MPTKGEKKLSLSIQYGIPKEGLPERPLVRKWVKASLEKSAEICIRIVDEEEGRECNLSFRGKDYPTNVLTFAYSESEPFTGDIMLCAPVIEREAQEQKKKTMDHYAHMVVHGVLHLQGYDHESEKDAEIMEEKERKILEKLHVPDPYSEV